MHSIVVFQRKTLYINCLHNRIFPKIWGGAKCITGPPSKIWGGAWPPGPPCGGPHAQDEPKNIKNFKNKQTVTNYFIFNYFVNF